MLTSDDLKGVAQLPFCGMSDKDINRYSISRVIRSLDRGAERITDGIEAEMNQELTRQKLGSMSVEGFAIPFDVLASPVGRRDLSVGTFGAGGATVQTTVSPSLIPILRNKTACIRAGATVLTGLTSNLSFPRQTSATQVQALGESATAGKSNPTLDQVNLSPKRAAAVVEYSRQLVLQSSIDVENWLREDLLAQIGIKLDYFLLNGQGAGSEPLGILNTPSIGSVAFGGTATWQKILAFENALATMNADVTDAKFAWITSPAVRTAWKGIAVALTGATTVSAKALWEKSPLADGTGEGLVNDYRAIPTNQVLNNGVIFGNWKEAILGMFGKGIDILVNPYSRDTDGVVRLTASSYADVGIRHPVSFCASADAGNQ